MTTNNFSASVSLNTGQSNRSIGNLTKGVNNLSKALENLDQNIKQSNGSLESVASSVNTSTDAMQRAIAASKELQAQRDAEAGSTDKAVSAEKKYADSFNQSAQAAEQSAAATGKAGTEAGNAAKGAKEFSGAQADVTQNTRTAKENTDQYSESLASHRYLMYDVGATYRTVATLLLGIPAATSAVAIAFEKDFAQVQRTTGLAGDAAYDYQRQLKDLATEIPSTFGELAEVSKIGGQMGIAQESLESFTDTVVRFVETSDGVNIDKASTAFGRLENMFNVTPTGELADPNFFKRIGSAIAYTGDNSVATEQAIIAMLEKTTASAKNAGLSIQETIAMSSAMVSSGLQPFLSSGFIIRFFGNFQKAAAQGGDAAAAMAQELGVTAEEFQNLVRNDPYEILHRVVTQMKGMDSVEGKQFLTRLGINGVQDPKVLNALSENLHVLDNAMSDVNESYASADYLDKSSEGIFNTTAANIQKMINAFMNLGDTIGKSNLPIFEQFITATTSLVSTVDNLIERSKVAQVIVGGFLAAMAATGVVAAFRSGLAFVNASLVMFRDAASKGALAGGRFGGMNRQMAEIMLYNKGATDAQVASMLKGRSAVEAYRIAIMAKRSELGRDTAATQANAGATAAHTAATQRATGGVAGFTAALATNTTAHGRHAAALTTTQQLGNGFRNTMGAVGGALGGLLNPAFLVPGAIIAIGTAMINEQANMNTYREGLAEVITSYNDFEGAYESAIQKMEEYQTKQWSFSSSPDTRGKSLLELAETAKITEDQLRKAFEGGSEGVKRLARDIEETRAELQDKPWWKAEDSDLTPQINALRALEGEFKAVTGAMEEKEAADERQALMGGDVAGVFDETGDAAEEAAESVNTFSQSLTDAMDTVFGMINAEAGLTQALDNMGKSLAASADLSTVTTEGIANIENYQRTVSAAMELMQQQLSDGTFNSVQEATAYYSEFFAGLEQQLISAGVNPEDAAYMTQQALEVMKMTLGAEGNELVAELDVDATGAYEVTNQTLADISEVINSGAFEIILDADGQPATANTWAVVNWIAEVMGITPEAVLDAIDGTATENTSAVWEYIIAVMHDDFTAQLDADGTPGMNNVANFYNWTMDRLDEITEGINIAGTDLNNLMSAYNSAPVPGLGVGGMIAFGGATPASRGRVTTTMSPAQAAAKRARNAPQAPTLAKSAPAMPSIPQPDFGALQRGYRDAAKAAGGAGNAAKNAGNAAKKAGDQGRKAGNQGARGATAAQKATDKAREAAEKAAQAARDWNKSWQDLQSWAGRVGEALSMAFDQKHAVQSAKDDYYSVLNGINDRLKQQKDRIKELREETRRLTAERKVELNEASKFERMADIAAKHGNDDRAKDYRDQAAAMRERAKEMSTQISANKAEQSTIQAGIGNLKGYSQAAIDNRQELRQLEQAALKVPQAYASIGASASEVARQTRIWTGNLRTHATDLGYTRSQVSRNTQSTSNYIKELKRVPKEIPTVATAKHSGVPAVNRALNDVARPRTSTVTPKVGNVAPANRGLGSVAAPRTAPMNANANTGKAKRDLDNTAKKRNARFGAVATGVSGVARTLNNTAKNRRSSIGAAATGVSRVNSRLNNAARNRTSTITVRTAGAVGFGVAGRYGFNQGGKVPAFNSGGEIPGKPPANPREDNLLASVDGNGLIAVRSKEYIVQEPAVKHYGLDYVDALNKMKLPKYYMGGSPGGGSGSGSADNGPVQLSAKSINQLAQAISQTTILEVSREELARTVSRGQMVNNQKKGIFNVGS